MTLPLLLTAALAYDAIPYPDCTAAEYFDISSLTCNTCPTGQKPDTSGLSCQCDDGILQYQDPSTATDAVGGWQCISCAFLGFAATRDGTHCMACTNSSGTPGTTLGFDAATGDCACPDGEALVERDGLGALLPNKMCLPCPATSILNSDGLCEPCPAEKMESQMVATLEGGFETVCKCVAGYEEKSVQQGWWGRDYYCLEQTAREELRSFETSAAYKVTYNDLLGAGTTEVDPSQIFDQLLMPSAVNCLRAVQASDGAPREQPLLQGNEACQALGNLCVLQMYDEDSKACELYRKMQAASDVEVNEEEQWKARLPALYYEPGPAVYTLNNVPLVVALDGPGSRLAYVLASYSLNGTYLGLTELSTELQLCTGVAKDPTAFRQFGVGVKVECDLKLDQLLATKEPTFYDLYLQVDGEQLYPIPVQLYNLRVDARRVNVPEESVISLQNDQLVRRFFAVDAASGREQGDALPTVLRYVKMAELRITIIENLPSSIYPPKLMLEYAEVQVPSTADDTAEAAAAALNVGLPSSFIAKYSMDMNNTTYVLSILFVISLVLWIIGWLVQMYLWSRRNQGGGGIDGAWIVKAISQLCRVFSDVFFWLVFGACGWMYCLFKNQDEVFVMMPPDDYLYPFRAFLCCTFGAKCLWVLDLVYSQAHHDVFFVDWEQPRGQQGDDKLPVSVWRSVFVANEWVRLQTSRAVSVEFNLLFLLFLMRGLDQEMYATEIPNDIGSPGVTPNPVLRYALSSFMLLVMSLCQWLFRWAIWDRFIEDRVWQFVDLLSTTNISCFLMEEKYYGHYLHGKSVHSHADSDMLDFNKNLKREQDQLCAKRGLQEDSDVQTFNIFLSRAVRENFDSIYERRSGLPGPKRGVDEKGRPRGFRAGPDEALERKREVNKFISSFVTQTEKQHKLEIRHKEYYERLVGLPPELGYSSRSVFLEDPQGLFKQMLLAGREYDLVLLSVLTYGMFDMIFEDTFIAIFATYLLDLAVRFLRRELAKKNIAAKTLIDDRLLL